MRNSNRIEFLCFFACEIILNISKFIYKIIKIFTVVNVVFLPPTLIASMYGMNFDFMPELSWKLGYPFAIGLMLVFTLAIFLIFKLKKWL